MNASDHNRPPHKPELLAPAGDWDMLRAAVANGADAVYFGLQDFNARRRAENFTLERLGEVMDYLHDHNVRGYVAFNTLIFPNELPRAEQFAAGIASAGADAAIVQDLGLMRLIRQVAPSLSVHASTQATQTHPAGIEQLAKLGVRRVILARELTIEQIAACRSAGLDVETFIHGALCVSYSGQCLASAYLWGRSANRGQCGQACRLPYQLLRDGVPLGDRRYPISPQDLSGLELLPDLLQADVCALKIEGRLKGPHYVAAIVQLYRAAIDAAAAGVKFQPTAQHRRQLAATFSRGGSSGFFKSPRAQVVAGDSPTSRGVFVGRVAEVDYSAVIVGLDPDCELAPVKPGDGLAFGDGDTPQGGRVYEARPWRMRQASFTARPARGAAEPQYARLGFGRNDIDLARIRVGEAVWKTDDPAVTKELEASWARDVVVHPAAVDFTVIASVGGAVTLSGRDTITGVRAQATWPGPAQEATKHPLSVESAASQLERLGDTPFALGTITLRAAADAPPAQTLPALVPRSTLNDLRRQVVEQLVAARRTARHAVTDPAALASLRTADRAAHTTAVAAEPVAEAGSDQPTAEAFQLHVLVRTREVLDAVLAWSGAAGMIYLDAEDAETSRELARACRRASRAFAIATPRILKPGEEWVLDTLLECEPAAMLVRNLASLGLLRQRQPNLPLIGDAGLNAANDLSVAYLDAQPLARVTPAYDLSSMHLEELCTIVQPSRLEVLAHQHMPMLHMQHCLSAREEACGRGCVAGPEGQAKPCPHENLELEDRNGERHPVWRDIVGRNTVFGSYVQTAMPYLPSLQSAGVRHFRVELLSEPPHQVTATLNLYADVLTRRASVSEAWPQLKALAPVTRGTWTGESTKRGS